MGLYRTIEEASAALNRPVVAIGNFDGVHRGHQAVFETLVERARRDGVDAAAMTFEPHPVRFFRPDVEEFRLTTLEQKARLITACGVDGVIALTFDASVASLTPDAFVDAILHRGLGVSCVMVGENFAFGKGRSGTIEDLRRLGAARGIDVAIIEPVEIDGEVVSSTRIRGCLKQGELDVVRRLLGRDYAVEGRVVEGDARGRELGFPTANIETVNPLLPPDGIYATRLIDAEYGTRYAASYIGGRPTFETTGRTLEAFVLDAEGPLDLYGHDVSLEFCAFIRPDEKFESADALVAQMHRDVATIRQYFGEDASSRA